MTGTPFSRAVSQAHHLPSFNVTDAPADLDAAHIAALGLAYWLAREHVGMVGSAFEAYAEDLLMPDARYRALQSDLRAADAAANAAYQALCNACNAAAPSIGDGTREWSGTANGKRVRVTWTAWVWMADVRVEDVE